MQRVRLSAVHWSSFGVFMVAVSATRIMRSAVMWRGRTLAISERNRGPSRRLLTSFRAAAVVAGLAGCCAACLTAGALVLMGDFCPFTPLPISGLVTVAFAAGLEWPAYGGRLVWFYSTVGNCSVARIFSTATRCFLRVKFHALMTYGATCELLAFTLADLSEISLWRRR